MERLARKEVLGKGTTRKGVWLVFSLDMKKMELLYELLWFECPRTCQRPESMLLCRSGLFRPLRFPAYEGTLVCLGVSSKTEDQEEKYLVGVPLVMKKASAWFLVFRGEPGDGVAGW